MPSALDASIHHGVPNNIGFHQGTIAIPASASGAPSGIPYPDGPPRTRFGH